MTVKNQDDKLVKFRNDIAIIDQKISKLLKKRFNVCQKIKKVKNKFNLPLTNASREKQVLLNVTAHAENQTEKNALITIYKAIISECTNIQK